MENLQKKPSKGILKSSSSFEQQNECQTQPKPEQTADKDIKWDEMNILQTLHPADKDYGHMKIEEPKTPYNYYIDTTDGEAAAAQDLHSVDASTLAANIASRGSELPSVLRRGSSDEESDYESLTEEEKKKRREFEVKRKMHYNEFQAVKLARKLLEQDEEEDNEGIDEVREADDVDTAETEPQPQATDADDGEDQRNGDHMSSASHSK